MKSPYISEETKKLYYRDRRRGDFHYIGQRPHQRTIWPEKRSFVSGRSSVGTGRWDGGEEFITNNRGNLTRLNPSTPFFRGSEKVRNKESAALWSGLGRAHRLTSIIIVIVTCVTRVRSANEKLLNFNGQRANKNQLNRGTDVIYTILIYNIRRYSVLSIDYGQR